MSDKAKLAKSEYDRVLGSLRDRNDVVFTKEVVIRDVPLWGVGEGSRTFIVQTAKVKEVGDYVFLDCVSDEGTVRMVLPPSVTSTINRQRGTAIKRNRRQVAKAVMADRMAAGFVPKPPRRKRKAK